MRLERTEKDELFGINDARHYTSYPIGRLSAGYMIDVFEASRATVGLGVAHSWNRIEGDLRAEYGKTPHGVLAFLQLTAH